MAFTGAHALLLDRREDAAADAPGEMEALVERARRGDRAAFTALYARFAPMVAAIAVAHAARADVEDVQQDVFLAAWQALPALRSDAHVGGWLAAIARHRAHRVRSRTRPTEPLHEHAAGAEPANDDAGTDVLAVLKTLPAAYRETLALRLIEGKGGEEIAALTGLTHGSVRVNLTRGMALLRAALEQRGWR